MKSLQLDVVATRGSIIESRHRVHAAVVDARGCLVAGAGEPTLVTHSRSCAKPFQVMPLLESGGFDALGWGDDQLALACGSHGGEPEHVAICQAMLESMGLEEGDLACGPHEPLSPRGARLVRESGARLAAAAAGGDDVPSRIMHAMVTRPFLVGGTDRFDSVLIEECEGCVVAKIGAEGVHTVAVPERGLGVALKVGDGAQRAQYPAVLRLLQLLEILPAELSPRLYEYMHRPVRNSRGEVVGEIRP